MSALDNRSGVTLIELLVSIALLGLITSVTTLALRRMEEQPPDDPVRMLADSLRVVVATGRPTTLRLMMNGEWALATLHADGSIVADSILRVDRLSGAIVERLPHSPIPPRF
jgi:prepilin-type N-terminal cleavage/methylation domain-containing protein